MTYTDKEIQVLSILADQHGSDWQICDGYDEGNEEIFGYFPPHIDTYLLTTDGTRRWGTIFSNFGLDPKVYRGVVSSLLQKGAIVDDEYEADRGMRIVPMVAIAITKEAFNTIRGAA